MFITPIKASLSKYKFHITLGLLILFVTLPNLYWIQESTLPMPKGDAYTYLTKTFEFINKIESDEGTTIIELMKTLNYGGRPPLYLLVSVPFILVLGRSISAALISNIFWEIIMIASTFGIGKTARNNKTGLLAALIVASYPPIIHHSHLYMPHYAQVACVALSLWLLFSLVKTRSVKIAWLFGFSLGIGWLTYIFFPYFLFVPTAILGIYMLFFQLPPPRPQDKSQILNWLKSKINIPFVKRGLLPSAIITITLSLTWYSLGFTREQMSLVLYRIDVSEIVITYGFPEIAPSFWWYAVTAPGAISIVFTLFLAIGLVYGIIKLRLFPFVSVISFLSVFIIFSLRTAIGWSYFVPALPIAAYITADWIFDTKNKWLSRILVSICIAVAIFIFTFVIFGQQPWNKSVAISLGYPKNSDTCSERFTMAFCPDPPAKENWQVKEIIQTILDDPQCEEKICSLMVVPMEREFGLTKSIVAFYLVKDFSESKILVEGQPTAWFTNEYNLKGLLNSDYVVFIPEHLSGEEAPFSNFLLSPPPSFSNAHQEYASYPLPREMTAIVLKRVKPLIIEEAQESINALELSDEGKAQSNDVLINLYIQTARQLVNEGNPSEAIELLHNALSLDQDVPEIWITLGLAYERSKSLDEAISAYERVITINPQHYWAHALLAEIYQKQGDWEKAAQFSKTALDLNDSIDRQKHSALLLLEAYANLDEREQICALLDTLEQGYEQATKYRILCLPQAIEITNLLDVRQYTDAFDQTLILLEDNDIEDIGKEYLAIDVGKELFSNQYTPEAYLLFHKAFLIQGSQEALDQMKILIEQTIESTQFEESEAYIYQLLDDKKISQEKASLVAYFARLLLDNGENNAVIDILTKNSLQYPSHVETWVNLGLAFSREGNGTQAINAYSKALNLDPYKYWPNHLLAQIYYDQGEWQQVIELETNALQSTDDRNLNAKSLWMIAIAHIHLGNFDAAIEAFAQSRETQNALDTPELANAFLDAIANEHYENLPNLVSIIISAQEIPPDDRGKLAVTVGRALSDAGQHDSALQILTMAAQIIPNNPELWSNFGLIYGRQGNSDKAIESYLKAIEIAPNQYWSNHLLAQLYFAKAQWLKVVNYEKAAINATPDKALKLKSMMNLAAAYTKLDNLILACRIQLLANRIDPSVKFSNDIQCGNVNTQPNIFLIKPNLGKR